MFFHKTKFLYHRIIRHTIFSVVFFVVLALSFLFASFTVFATQVTIDSGVDVTTTQHNGSSPTTVFTTENMGYTFYVDAGGDCVYSKTTDGGANWGSAVAVDPQPDCIMVSVWYDQWTPGDNSGTYIHVATIDTSTDDIYYTRVDTSNDTISTSINVTQGSSYAGSLAAGANMASITKSTDGTLYASVLDASDDIVVRCTTTCTTATNWSENSPTFAVGNDWPLLVPLLSGNVMLIQWDISASTLESKVFNGSTWDASWTTIEGAANNNTTYDGAFGAVVNKTTGAVYLAFVDDANTIGTNDDVKTLTYSGGTWTTKTDVVTNSVCAGVSNCGLTGTKIARDAFSGDLYVIYTARTTSGTATTGNIYWKRSTDGMTTWGTEQGPINTSSDDIYGARINILGPRLYASWYEATPDSLFGENVLIPTVTVATTSSQVASLGINTTNQYVGGAFVFNHTTSSTTISSVTITETGTVDAQTQLDNIKLFYDFDTTAPYDCVSESYGGSELQFGTTDTDGFSAADGTSVFSGGLSVSTTSAVCMYVVLDVVAGTPDSSTLDIEISNPSVDVTTTNGIITPSSTRALAGSTLLQTAALTQMHYHWRNDNGSETTATSATSGVEDTPITSLLPGGVRRVRLEVSNEGSLTSGSVAFRLEYGQLDTVCSDVVTWTDVGAAGGDWDIYNSTNLTDGNDTTNITSGVGGVTDENTTFLTPNGGIKDTSSQTGGITLSTTQFVELEFSLQASTTAPEGNSYCFRVTDAGTPLTQYDVYPRASISADVIVSVVGSQSVNTSIPTTDFYVGGAFALKENSSSHNVTSITITESGTVDAQNDLDNIRLFYESDVSPPYDCASESYAGTETPYGSTDTDGFSAADGTSTFTGNVAVTTTSTMCVYVVLDVLTTANNDETVSVGIFDSTVDVVVDGGGSTSPTALRSLGSTDLQAPLLTQTHFHFRNDDGSESAASSQTDGVEDTALSGVLKNETTRLRLEVSNEGSGTSASLPYTLQYGERMTSCSAISTWIDVGDSGGAFDMSDSFNLTNGSNTTNIAVSSGGTTDENSTFLTSNGGVLDTSSQSGNVILAGTEFTEFEFSFEATDEAINGATYCFRLTTNTTDQLYAYSQYPELTIQTARDFYVQRGNVTIANGDLTATITAGADYIAPHSASSAFVRITNTQHTGAGHNVGGGNQNADDVTVYIANPENILSSINFARFGGANTTRVSWEIIEYVGPSGGDNEMVVRTATTTVFGIADNYATTSVSGVTDDNDVVVFVTGAGNPDTTTGDYNTVLVTSDWSGATDEAVLTRDSTSNDAVAISWSAVEFTGPNWVIQRVEHTYTANNIEELESINSVNDVSRAFIHTQKRNGVGLQGLDEFGHEVWLSSPSTISFFLQSGATTPSGQVSVAWVIENTQTSGTPMIVTRSNGTQSGGVEPLSVNIDIGKILADITTASIFANNRVSGTGTAFPRAMMGVEIISTTQYELWLSDTGNVRTYRTEVVEWPTAVRTFTQNYYRFYVDDDNLDPSDPWPVGGSNLGENTSITVADDPLGGGDRIRMRMSVTVRGSNLTASTTAFKLQFGVRSTSCSAITTWLDVGDAASTTAEWRGYNGSPVNGASLSGNPPTVGQLNISVSDRAGSYVEENVSPGNPYKVFIGEDVEYDWVVENNVAADQTTYCFRMIEYNNTVFESYSFYPTALTAGFQVQTQNWRWYDDAENETPTTALAAENTAPTDVAFDNDIKLRITAQEIGGATGLNVKFKLQFSEYSDFSQNVVDVDEIGTCTAASFWCYIDGNGVDNATTTSTVLTDSDACVSSVGDGCGSHNESAVVGGTFSQQALAATEYEFALKQFGARVNVTYFFRLYDVVNDVPVVTAGSYPSVVTEGAALSFSISGLASGTGTEGVATDISTTPTEVGFGTLLAATPLEAAQRLTVTTNATSGYRIFAFERQGLLSGTTAINPVTGTNALPSGWGTGCTGGASGCYGYHTGDDVLSGTPSRFAADDTYAQFSATPEEIIYNAAPIADEQVDIVYKVEIQGNQAAGQYSSNVVFIIVPTF